MADDSLDPFEISRKRFELVRRGYDPQEVGAFLQRIAELVVPLQQELRDLRDQLEHPDEARLMTVLGEETARVLTSARESAAEIRIRAETEAARMIAGAEAEATATRASLQADVERLRADA